MSPTAKTPSPPAPSPSSSPSPVPAPTAVELRLGAAGARVAAPPISFLMQAALLNPDLISLAAGFVEQSSLPVGLVAEIVGDLARDPDRGRRALQYGTTQGDLELRRALVRRIEAEHRQPDGAWADAADRLVVTTGSQQLLALVSDALLDPGDIVIVESPTYFVFLGMLESRGARTFGVPVDEGGMRIDALDAAFAELERRGELDRVKLVYTIPEHANPTGLSLAPERRPALLDVARKWSKRHRILVLEDSAYRGLGFEDGPEPPSLWALDRAREADGEPPRVIHARTFSKTFSPGMKVGYGALPPELVAPVVSLKGNQDFGTANFNQRILVEALKAGRFDAHVEGVRRAYHRKRDVVLAALREHFRPFGDRVSWTEPRGGMYVWLTLPPDLDARGDGPLFRRATAEGMLYVPGDLAFAAEPTPPPRNVIRISYGLPPETDLAEGIARLARAARAISG